MGTAYGVSGCVGWYRAGVGVYSDAGSTLALAGDGVYQWNDQSGAGNHLTQTVSANRPIFNDYGTKLTSAGLVTISPYSAGVFSYRVSSPPALLFDGSNSYLNMPSSISIPNTGCTVFLCTRGAYFSPISFSATKQGNAYSLRL